MRQHEHEHRTQQGGAERRGGGTSTIKDLLAAMHEENRGNRRYRPGHEPAADGEVPSATRPDPTSDPTSVPAALPPA